MFGLLCSEGHPECMPCFTNPTPTILKICSALQIQLQQLQLPDMVKYKPTVNILLIWLDFSYRSSKKAVVVGTINNCGRFWFLLMAL